MTLLADDAERARLAGIARAIGVMHARSWQSAYRGIFPDHFLDHEVDADRARHWQARVRELSAGTGEVFLAALGTKPVGFLCIEIGPEPEWGAFVDNLHVLPSARGGNIGGALIRQAAAWARRHGQSQLYLWVYEANEPARRFYDRDGWREAERQVHGVPGGGEAPVWRLIKRL